MGTQGWGYGAMGAMESQGWCHRDGDIGTWEHGDGDTGLGTWGHGKVRNTGIGTWGRGQGLWDDCGVALGDLRVTTPIGWCHVMDSHCHHADCHSNSPGTV